MSVPQEEGKRKQDYSILFSLQRGARGGCWHCERGFGRGLFSISVSVFICYFELEKSCALSFSLLFPTLMYE